MDKSQNSRDFWTSLDVLVNLISSRYEKVYFIDKEGELLNNLTVIEERLFNKCVRYLENSNIKIEENISIAANAERLLVIMFTMRKFDTMNKVRKGRKTYDIYYNSKDEQQVIQELSKL